MAPFNGNGVYNFPSLPGSFNPAIVGQPATAADWNALRDDLQTGLSTALCRDGQSAVTADIPFANHKLTGVKDPTSAQDAATKAYVDTAVYGAPGTGARLSFLGTASQVWAGWVILRGLSIGNASSGATERANADCEALFELLWPNTNFTLQDSSGSTVARGADAATDWAANRRLVLPNYTNVFPYTVSDGTADPGDTGGAATHTHTASLSASISSITVSGSFSGNTGDAFGTTQQTNNTGASSVTTNSHQHGFSGSVTSTGSGSGTASGTTASASNIPPYVVELALIKL